MDKFVGKWEMIPQISKPSDGIPLRNNTRTFRRLRHDALMIHSEWETTDSKSHFRGYAVYVDGIPRKGVGDDLQYVTQIKNENTLTTAKMEDDRVKSMEIREILDNGHLKITTIHIGQQGEQIKDTFYYRRIGTAS